MDNCHWTRKDSNLQFCERIVPNFWYCSTQKSSMSFSSCSFFLRATSCLGVAKKCCHAVSQGDLPLTSHNGYCKAQINPNHLMSFRLSYLIFQVPNFGFTLCFAKLLSKFRNQLGSHLEDMTLCVFHLSQKLRGQSQVASQPLLPVWSVVYTCSSQSLPFKMVNGWPKPPNPPVLFQHYLLQSPPLLVSCSRRSQNVPSTIQFSHLWLWLSAIERQSKMKNHLYSLYPKDRPKNDMRTLDPTSSTFARTSGKADGCNGCKSRSWCIAGSLSPCWLVTAFISILSSQPSLWTRWLPYVAQSSSALQHHIVDWPQTTCSVDSVTVCAMPFPAMQLSHH